MTLSEVTIASVAHRAAEHRLATYAAAAGVAVRRGDGWFAVRTGADSNDLNGVVSDWRADVCARLITDLVAWFATAPASWLTSRPDAGLTRLLLSAGAQVERTGRWSGGRMPALPAPSITPVEVVPVRSERDLDRWLDLATDAGWISGEADRCARRELYRRVRADRALTHWLALDGDHPVGFASSCVDGDVLDLCNLYVAEARRRSGIGRALVAARVAEATARGATTVVSSPSPEGWQLQKALGFQSVPVTPDTCFYLPTK